VAVNPVTNKVYVANVGSNNVTVIDGAANTTTTVAAGTSPRAVAVNPVTNKVYVANYISSNVTAISEQQATANGLMTAITPLSGDQSDNLFPAFTLSSLNYLYPTGIEATYYQADTWQGQWQTYTPGGTNRTPALTPGEHILYAFATDGQAATSGNTGQQSSPLIGTMTAYWFLVQDTSGPSVTLSTAANPTRLSPLSVTAAFSEPVIGFTSTSVQVANGSIGSFTGSGSDYEFEVTPVSQGTVTVSLPAGAAQDAAGNGNTEATPLSITYDTTQPNAAITGAGATVNAPFTATITFDKPVTGLTLANIIVTNGTASDLTSSTPNLVWTVLITPTGLPGQPVTITIIGVTDSAGNNSTTATPLATMVQPTAALSPATIAFGGTGVGGSSETQTATFTNTSAGLVTLGTVTLTGTNSGDFLVSGGTCTDSGAVAAGASCAVTVAFTPRNAGTRSAELSVTSDAATSPHTAALSGRGTISAESLVIDPASPATLYAGLDGAGIYKSINSGTSWIAATVQPANPQVRAVVIKPGDGAKLYAATYGGGIYTSTDSGDTWTACANTNLSNLNVISLTIDSNGKLYAGTGAGVFTSSDNCAAWTAINSGLPE
jgi:YVTN family beta-propeller protein